MWRPIELADAIWAGGRIAWVAGEKDADALRATGEYDAVTTTHQGEAADVYPAQFGIFRDFGGLVDVVCDDDPTGWAYGIARVSGLVAVGVPRVSIRLLLPAEGFNDVYDALSDADGRVRGFRPVRETELRERVRSAKREKDSRVAGKGSAEKLAEFEKALADAGRKRGTGQDWTCPHPAHDDKHPSFGVAVGDNGGLVLNCQTCMPRSGTPEHREWVDDVLDAIGLEADAIAPPKRRKASSGKGGERETVAEKLVAMAQEDYTLGISDEGRPFAVQNGGHIAMFFDRGTGQFANYLAAEYNRRYGKTAGNASVSDAISTLTGYAWGKDPEEIALRVAAVPGDVDRRIVIDMGDSRQTVVIVGPGGWEVSDRSPVLFRRTKATDAFPVPERSEDWASALQDFESLLNVSEEDFELIVAYMACAFIPDIQHPAMMLNGEHGTGKSDATRMITQLLDPSVAPLRKRPRDEREWSVAASASWVVSLENMSWIEPWLSDDLCTAITGAGDIERQFHTNDDVRIRKIRRVILMNGIDPGGVRGDLADRMFAIRLQRIMHRLSEIELTAKFEGMRARIFGALLDLLVEVQRIRLSGANYVETNERMYDFALAAKAVDLAWGSSAFERYIELREDGMAEVTEDDPLTAIVKRTLRESRGEIIGTPAAIFELLDLDTRQSGMPKTPRALSQAFTRLAPGWSDMGMVFLRRKAKGVRMFEIRLESEDEIGNGE
jgi:hypothetical protein